MIESLRSLCCITFKHAKINQNLNKTDAISVSTYTIKLFCASTNKLLSYTQSQ